MNEDVHISTTISTDHHYDIKENNFLCKDKQVRITHKSAANNNTKFISLDCEHYKNRSM